MNHELLIVLSITCSLLFFAVGLMLGREAEASLWRNKGNPDHRTAMCSGGKFFYVVTEKEYIEYILKRR
jgi:hypothetical protein